MINMIKNIIMIIVIVAIFTVVVIIIKFLRTFIFLNNTKTTERLYDTKSFDSTVIACHIKGRTWMTFLSQHIRHMATAIKIFTS